MINFQKILFYTFLLFSNSSAAFTAEEERWLNSDIDSDTSQVNEGKLEFILERQKRAVMHSANTLIINKKSIDDGWVALQQCYRHLDKLAELDITYQYRFIKNLSIISKRNIDSAVIKDQGIMLKNITDNSELCVSAEVRIFYQNPDLSFSLVNGPYHRRFLDGYYAYHLSLTVLYPDELLRFKATQPVDQPGFKVIHAAKSIIVDTHFKGILNTEVIFELIK
ncbi:MAG: hypothetical protein OEY11_13735 [Gammaproteobacteria bacterium]|nr:hypothetical protein [Gammaproteobacteria bacterium]